MKNIQRPTLIIDKKKCLKNISFFVEKAKTNNLIFRPHFKTHNSIIIGEWYKKLGVKKITTSSVSMTEKFAENGWNDITLAFPLNILEIEKLNIIAENITLNLLISCSEHSNFLHKISKKINLFIELDLGYHRSGFELLDINSIKKMIDEIHGQDLKFAGFLTHEGQNYLAKSVTQIGSFHDTTIANLEKLQSYFDEEIFISVGDTPSCKTQKNFSNIDEIRPGNFVFYDLMQENIGSCNFDEISVAVACPVVSKNENLNQLIIYGGAIHLSKEFIEINGKKIFGKIVIFDKNGWSKPIPNTYLISVSQEHGIVRTDKQTLSEICVGDVIGVIPVHSCLTNNLLSAHTQII